MSEPTAHQRVGSSLILVHLRFDLSLVAADCQTRKRAVDFPNIFHFEVL